MPVRRRRSPSSSELRTYGGTEEDRDIGDLDASATGRVTSSIDGLPSNCNGIGKNGVTSITRTSTSCRDTEPATAAPGGGAVAAATATTPNSTPTPPSNDPLGATSGPISSQRSSLHQPGPDAELSDRTLDGTSADVLATRRRVAFRSAMNRIGRRNGVHRQQMPRANMGEYRQPYTSTMLSPAPLDGTTARSSFFGVAEPTITTTAAGGGFDLATNRENEGSGNSNGNSNGNNPTPQQSVVTSQELGSEPIAAIRERLQRLQHSPPPLQQQQRIHESPLQAPQTPTSSPPPPSAINPPSSTDHFRTPSPTTEASRRSRAISGPLRRRMIRRNANPQGRAPIESSHIGSSNTDGSTTGTAEATSASVRARWGQLPSTRVRHGEASITNSRPRGVFRPLVERAWGAAANAPAGGTNVVERPWGIAPAAGADVVVRPWGATPPVPAAGANVRGAGTWGTAANVRAAGPTATAGSRPRIRRNAIYIPNRTANRLLHVGERGGGRVTAAAAATPTGEGREAVISAGEGGLAAPAGGARTAASTDTPTEGRPAVATSIHQLHKASVVGDLLAISQYIANGGNLEAQSFCG